MNESPTIGSDLVFGPSFWPLGHRLIVGDIVDVRFLVGGFPSRHNFPPVSHFVGVIVVTVLVLLSFVGGSCVVELGRGSGHSPRISLLEEHFDVQVSGEGKPPPLVRTSLLGPFWPLSGRGRRG